MCVGKVFSTLQWDDRSVLASPAAVIRPQHRLRASLLCHDILVKQPKTALNQFLEPRDEACGWRPIDNIMIETDGQTQVLADSDLPVHDAWFRCDAAEGEHEAIGGVAGYAPANTFADHPHCRDPARSDHSFPQERGSAPRPPQEPDNQAWPSRKHSRQPARHFLHELRSGLLLKGSDLLVNLPGGFVI